MAAYQLINGGSSEVLKQFPDNHFDSVVCDPPYLIGFLGKGWDHSDNDLGPVFKECLRVLKPGGHLLAFSAARTYHKLATTIEEAGFEIRDQIMWIYASGFPKSQDVGKSIQRSLGVKETKITKSLNGYAKEQTTHGAQRVGDVSKEDYEDTIKQTICTDDAAKEWSGWGTQLKPAHEPICMARKPLKQTIAKNCQQYGTGAINIDAGRIAYNNDKPKSQLMPTIQSAIGGGDANVVSSLMSEVNDKGRFPSNVLGDIEGYQKFFYQPKVSRKERHCGFELPKALTGQVKGCYSEDGTRMAVGFDNATGNRGNNHPTVKPVALMDYLIKLVTKPGGKVLDPFNGSGSTGMAAVKAGYEYVGIDLDPKYIEISRKRIDAWCAEDPQDTNYDELFTEEGDE